MNSSVWVVKNNQIELKRALGVMVRTSAMEIYQVVFGISDSVGGEFVSNPAEDIPQIAFSRQPARPALRISWGGTRCMVAKFGVATDEGFCEVSENQDQVIHELRWYPIRIDEMRRALAWLEKIGVGIHARLTIGSLVALRARQDRPCVLFDELAFDPSGSMHGLPERGDIPGFHGVLYPYQTSGVAFLALIAEQGVGCILGDEMGLGKTAQLIALLQIEKNVGHGPAIVVAPATLLENWRRELGFFAPELTVLLHSGVERGGVAMRLRGFDVVLISYDTMVRDEELLVQIRWNVLALDEAQAIKNPEALRTMAAKRLDRRVSIAVTGTPLENRIEDLWSLADFALPGLLGERQAFLSSFGNLIEDAARLAPVVAPLLLRRKVIDVAQDLPARIEVPQALEMPLPLAKAYEELRKRTLEEFGPAGGLVATTRLRMLCTHPKLVGKWDQDPTVDVPKYVRTIELLEEIFSAGEKALIFSTYQQMADLLMSDIPKRFPTGYFNIIDGRVDGALRQGVVDQFFEHKGYGALFLNPKAAGSGLNITAANHVIHYNPEWNPALTAQASARSYRRKQQRPVTIHHLFYLKTIEEVIRDSATFKTELADEAVTGHDGYVDPMVMAQSVKISPFSSNREV